MEGLLAHSLLVVTGKGGVGKSTVAAALGLRASQRGLRTIVAEVAARDDVSPVLGASSAADAHGERVISDGLHHISIDPQRAMEEYLRKQLPMGVLAAPLSRSRIFTTLTAATPGMRELLTIGKVWELAQHGRRSSRAAAPYDLVVLDAPATGHGLALLEAPGTFASVARVGPVAEQGRAIASFLHDPGRTAVLTVSTAEEMAVDETLQLRSRLRADRAWTLAWSSSTPSFRTHSPALTSGRYARRRRRRRGTRRCLWPGGLPISARRSPGCDTDCRAWN